MSEVTQLLAAIDRGDSHATAALLPLVYDELRRLARAHMANERGDHTLQATGLVHEAYLRLVGNSSPGWDGRGHFFAAAAEAMRRILVENARRKHRKKHGGGQHRLDIDIAQLQQPLPDEDVLDLDEALTKLSLEDPAKAKLVQLRFFAGLTNDEAAGVLGISAITAKRHWRYARAWLHREIGS